MKHKNGQTVRRKHISEIDNIFGMVSCRVTNDNEETADTKLSLSVDEAKELDDYINSERALSADLETKINKFIDGK